MNFDTKGTIAKINRILDCVDDMKNVERQAAFRLYKSQGHDDWGTGAQEIERIDREVGAALGEVARLQSLVDHYVDNNLV